MKEPLLNSHTKAALQRAVNRNAHAILLTGELGTGLMTIAEYLQILLKKDNKSLVKLILKPDEKSTIMIDQVRELRNIAKHKNTASQIELCIMVVVSTIDDMQHEAQNALLKLLEEPPMGLLFVVLNHNRSLMLSTIESRCVHVPVLPVSQKEAAKYFNVAIDNLSKSYAISDGLPGLLVQLYSDQEHPILDDIAAAKSVLGSSVFDRLLLIDSLYKSNENANKLVSALDKICRAALKGGSHNDKWINNSLIILSAKEKLSARVQAKLVIDELFINLR